MTEFEPYLVYAFYGLLAFVPVVGLFAYLSVESENRSHRRLKRKIKKALAISIGVAFAFVGSLAVGHLVGTIGTTEPTQHVTDPGLSPLYLVLAFLVVVAVAGVVGLAIAACLQNLRSRNAHN